MAINTRMNDLISKSEWETESRQGKKMLQVKAGIGRRVTIFNHSY